MARRPSESEAQNVGAVRSCCATASRPMKPVTAHLRRSAGVEPGAACPTPSRPAATRSARPSRPPERTTARIMRSSSSKSTTQPAAPARTTSSRARSAAMSADTASLLSSSRSRLAVESRHSCFSVVHACAATAPRPCDSSATAARTSLVPVMWRHTAPPASPSVIRERSTRARCSGSGVHSSLSSAATSPGMLDMAATASALGVSASRRVRSPSMIARVAVLRSASVTRATGSLALASSSSSGSNAGASALPSAASSFPSALAGGALAPAPPIARPDPSPGAPRSPGSLASGPTLRLVAFVRTARWQSGERTSNARARTAEAWLAGASLWPSMPTSASTPPNSSTAVA
mmetsp:Transcript_9594/g.33717  ORF Transcript_9594/g.33717 Transcript_9594/m.33717 type:complete len:349 (+) Transcript_9594:2884-3930(+)